MSTSLGRSTVPNNTRIYAVGDIHGHTTLLEELHNKIKCDLNKNPVADYKIIFLGDYIDRGPDSAGCIDFLIKQMARDSHIVCLKGNHEDKLEEFLINPAAVLDSFFTYGGIDCVNSYGIDMSNYRGTLNEALQIAVELKDRLPELHKQFLAQLQLSVTIGDYMFVHAGVHPGLALDQQSDDVLMWIRSEFINHTELYDKVIVHGHTPSYPMEILPNRINVDTHAYQTGILSCIVLEDKNYRVLEAQIP